MALWFFSDPIIQSPLVTAPEVQIAAQTAEQHLCLADLCQMQWVQWSHKKHPGMFTCKTIYKCCFCQQSWRFVMILHQNIMEFTSNSTDFTNIFSHFSPPKSGFSPPKVLISSTNNCEHHQFCSILPRTCLVGGWPTPLKNMSWDDDILNIWTNKKIQTTNQMLVCQQHHHMRNSPKRGDVTNVSYISIISPAGMRIERPGMRFLFHIRHLCYRQKLEFDQHKYMDLPRISHQKLAMISLTRLEVHTQTWNFGICK